ncbi:MAG: ribosome small subunit-dependent GTPase A [Lachnospiraceae bacterium]|nr:ribosome small subunit-dependent GTPase A [Lachnospiraceae bacterium]MBQ2105630.1 ribosome small subunit-dependent GTPase A [Lachnospiraceae bacterium]MBQ2425460.1 ribosome small subunit-dependent GTPase A [Lachnospiraceae bacterium]MBQ5915536.1 ribosome small subunit-dependent GTPase A [Lachnospiraceae bacterium]MBR0306291.1 ribosome small subunit-dependent GTPase A [Lachnospiraceae bacterium]
MTGKIMKGIAGFYYVHDGISGVYECKAKGIFRNKKIKPLVGDDVEFTILDEEEKTGNIVDILDRENELIRPAVANIDQAMVVFAATAPEPNLNLLDRFLVTMESQDVPVVICFNKKDLVTEEEAKRLTSIYEAAGYEVHLTNAKSGEGIEQIRSLLRGKTTVLAGPSGVGKSTITNEIQPEAEMETGTISEKIKRGKHTTRHSELFFVETDTFVMDTPGFSSMFVDNMKPEELQQFFPEFEEFIPDCRFLGCVHVGERECGVKDAVKEGTLSKDRYENYRLIYEELKNKRRY